MRDRMTQAQMRAAFHVGRTSRGRGRPSQAFLDAEEAEAHRIAARAAAADLGLLGGEEATEARRAYRERLGPFPEAAELFLSGEYELPPDIAEHIGDH